MPRPRLLLYAGLAVFALVGLVASFVYEAQVEKTRVQMYAPEPVPPEAEFAEMPVVRRDQFSEFLRFNADQWIRSVWRACNTGDLDGDPRWRPPPPTLHGQMYMGACQALGGHADRSREIIDALPQANRTEAAGILSWVMFPAARQGRYEVAGPAMELVLEHWPTMDMAVFYAGLWRLAAGELDRAREYFLSYLLMTTSGTGTAVDARREKARELVARIDAASASVASQGP